MLTHENPVPENPPLTTPQPETPPPEPVDGIVNADYDYTQEELDAISPWREAYQNQHKRAKRIHMMKDEIFPAMFNYWGDSGLDPLGDPTLAAKAQRLAGYIRRNWRRPRRLKFDVKGKIVIRPHDLVRELLAEQVHAEMLRVLNCNTPISTRDPRYLGALSTATKNIRKAMTPSERRMILNAKKEREEKGHPVEVQRAIYEKEGDLRVKKAAADNYLSMGMVQWTMTAVRNADGRWVIEIADHAAGNMGVNSSSLKRSFPAEVEALKARWFEYLRHLNDMQNPTAAPTAAQMIPRHDRQVLKDEAGYPIMPPEPPATIHQSNKDLMRILRTYFNEHYHKAAGYEQNRVPFKDVAGKIESYIDPEYIPAGFKFRDPTDMVRGEIIDLMTHIRRRQAEHGISKAFRFKCFTRGRQGELLVSMYDDAGGADPATDAPKVAAKSKATRGKAKRKGKQVQAVNEHQHLHPTDFNLWDEPGPIPQPNDAAAGFRPPASPPSQNAPEPASPFQAPGTIPARPLPRPRHRTHAAAPSPAILPHTPVAPSTPEQHIDPSPGPTGDVIVDNSTYHRMRLFDPTLPHHSANSPDDGMPLYSVPAAVYSQFLANPDTVLTTSKKRPRESNITEDTTSNKRLRKVAIKPAKAGHKKQTATKFTPTMPANKLPARITLVVNPADVPGNINDPAAPQAEQILVRSARRRTQHRERLHG